MVLGECHQNCREAARVYAERYPLQDNHSYNVFQRLALRVRTKGVVQPTYHINLHQELTVNDLQNRLNFCNWFVNTDLDFQLRILWTDEATFKSNGQMNLHNAHYWSPVNPHWLREVDYQHVWSLNTWNSHHVGFSGTYLHFMHCSPLGGSVRFEVGLFSGFGSMVESTTDWI